MRNKSQDNENETTIKEETVINTGSTDPAGEAVKTVEQLASEAALDAAIPEIQNDVEIPVSPANGPEMVTDTANNLAQFLNFGSLMLGAAKFEKVAAVWNPTDNKRLADAAIPVLRKSAWGLKFIEFLDGKSGVEELALLMVAAPMAIGTYKAVQDDLEAMKPKQAAKDPEQNTEEAAA